VATLSLENLVKIYKGKQVVNAVNMEIKNGHVVGLLGPNGAGKTTTFYMTVGMIKPDQGHVFIDDEDITNFPMYVRARKGVGYLPQETSVFKKLTVKQNILAILEMVSNTKSIQEKQAEMLLDELGIKHLKNQKANLLSGGERRRLEITRALATNPSFILLDEPFAGIDPLAVIDIKNIIVHLKNRGIGILISDHNVRETLEVCDNSETARRIYLGDEFKL
jgi:lipopolysaccharide export system ATP-binding protein